VLALLLFLSGTSVPAAAANPKETLKAAFVRGGDLWIKIGDQEKRLTNSEDARLPKWSADGEWIAYAAGEEERELKIASVTTGGSRTVSTEADAGYLWSPDRNELAFTVDRTLYAVRPERPESPTEIAQGVGDFSWLPDGKGFIASLAAELLPEGWTPVKIVEIPWKGHGSPGKARTLRTLPKASDDFFAVGTSKFKFSASGKWIAFLATPTASLSADANYLCILSADGSVFHSVDQMVRNEDWFKWADRGDTLAYVSGVGREAYRNKRLKTIRIPAKGKQAVYTPPGYSDQGLTWEGVRRIVVSRAAEPAKEDGGIDNRPLPKLAEIELPGGRARTIANPPSGYGDFSPQFWPLEARLVWIRSDRSRADAMKSGRGGKQPSVWIKSIDLGSNFYGQWNWNEVFAVHS